MSHLDIPKTEWWSILEPLVGKYDARQVFEDFIRVTACAISHPHREKEFISVESRYTAAEFALLAYAMGNLTFERVLNPFTDTLGPTYMALVSKSEKDDQGKVYTPQPLAELLSMLTFSDELDKDMPADDPITLIDPACGAGVMLMAAAQVAHKTGKLDRMYVHAADLDYIATQMTLINLSFAQVKGTVQHTNSLTGEVRESWYTNTAFLHTFAGPIVNVIGSLGDKS